jgi:DNA-binding CsgD family transcriptional regulator
MEFSRSEAVGLDKEWRRAAIAAEERGQGPVDWRATWRSLRTGILRVKCTFSTPERHYVLLSVRASVSSLETTPTSTPILENWLRGIPQKVLSLELGLPASCVTSRLKRGLSSLGLDCQPSQVPLVVGLLAAASTGRAPLVDARIGALTLDGERYLVLGVARPETMLAQQLPPAEYQTLCLLTEGHSYARIATNRKVAGRTVANQVASVFRRLGVSGRSELRGYLLGVSSGAL